MSVVRKIRQARVLTSSKTLMVLLSVVISNHAFRAIDSELAEFRRIKYDDAYITFRYAANLARGVGFVFNSGDQTNAASAPLYGILLGILNLFTRISIPQLADYCQWFGIFLICLSTLLIVNKSRFNILATSSAAIFCWIFVENGHIQYWAASGMETVFYLGVAMFPLALIISSDSKIIPMGQNRYTVLVLSVCVLTSFRLEAAIFVFSIILSLILTNLTSKSELFHRRHLTLALSSAATFFGVILINRVYFGRFFGDPVHQKNIVLPYVPDAIRARRLIKELIWGLNRPLLFLAVVALVLLLFKPVKNAGVLVLFTVLASTVYIYLLFVPWSDEYRYQVLLFVPTVLLIATIPNSIRENTIDLAVPIKTVLLGIALLGLAFSTTKIGNSNRQSLAIVKGTSWAWYVQDSRIEIGKYMERNLPPGSRVISGDLGALSFFNLSNTYIDFSGLVNRELLDNVSNGGDFASTLFGQAEYITDTGRGGLDTALDSIWTNPSSFFIQDKTNVYTSCSSSEAYSKEKVMQSPQEMQPGGLFVSVFKILWKKC